MEPLSNTAVSGPETGRVDGFRVSVRSAESRFVGPIDTRNSMGVHLISRRLGERLLAIAKENPVIKAKKLAKI